MILRLQLRSNFPPFHADRISLSNHLYVLSTTILETSPNSPCPVCSVRKWPFYHGSRVKFKMLGQCCSSIFPWDVYQFCTLCKVYKILIIFTGICSSMRTLRHYPRQLVKCGWPSSAQHLKPGYRTCHVREKRTISLRSCIANLNK